MKGKQVLLFAFAWFGPVLLITATLLYLILPEREGSGFFYIACAYNGFVMLVGVFENTKKLPTQTYHGLGRRL